MENHFHLTPPHSLILCSLYLILLLLRYMPMYIRSLFIRLLLIGCALLAAASAQVVDVFPTEPDKFLAPFIATVNRDGTQKARDAMQDFAKQWNDIAGFTSVDKEKFIQQANIMLSVKKYAADREILAFAQAFSVAARTSNYARLDMSEFFEVSMGCIMELEPMRLRIFYENLAKYLREGYIVNRVGYSWKIDQKDPHLEIVDIPDGKGGTFARPVVRLSHTNLHYKSPNDTTLVGNTSGLVDLVSLTFLGVGGEVNWMKVNLSKEDVYAVLDKYLMNFNSGTVEADSVTFYYKSLIKEPLKGRFEDKGLGFKSLNTANYPYFKSYGGGVVIENLIQDVRYEGGFSLKGIRKVGSGYDLVTYEKMEDSGDSGSDPYSSEYYEDEQNVDEAINETLDEFGIQAEEDEKTDFSEFGTGDNSEITDDTDPFAEDDDMGMGDEDSELSDTSETPAETPATADTGEEPAAVGNIPQMDLSNAVEVTRHIPAHLLIRHNGEYVLSLKGEEIVLDQERLTGKNMEVAMYLTKTDSLYHPSMDLMYEVAAKKMTLKKPRKSLYPEVPFTSNYHKYYLYFESITWDINTSDIYFTAFVDKEHKVSAVESFDYFNKERFNQYKGILKINPLGAIYRHKLEDKVDKVYAKNVMRRFGLQNQQQAFDKSLPRLQGAGYIRYHPERNAGLERELLRQNKIVKEEDVADYLIEPQQKLFDWMRAARDKKDYDAIFIISKVDTGAHARLNIQDKQMELFGVKNFSISDSQFVAIRPEDKVIIKENRNLEFGGMMGAGRMNFYTSKKDGFKFDYESYSIECDEIDSMRFVLVRNPKPGYEYTPLERALGNTVFERVSGKVHIDDPRNKSGKEKKKYAHYPVFDSYKDSYVYWARPEVQGGVYTKDKLFFSVDPFVLDSLEDFSEKNLNFDGSFTSSEIFPEFRQTLAVMPDFSLGFKQQAPIEGYPIYNGAGKFYNEITMDSYGLHGKGDIEYLGSLAKSDTFVFHFDSVMAVTNHFHLDKGPRGGAYFPSIDSDTSGYKWYTKENTLKISSMQKPLDVFEGQGKFTGTITITEKGAWGKGALAIGQITIEGDSIVLQEEGVKAFESNFIVTDKDDPSLKHFEAEKVTVDYDLEKHISKFEREKASDSLLAEFPIHQYHTTLIKGVYTRDEDKLDIVGLSSYAKQNYFVSVAPKKDSLNFMATSARYDVLQRRINVSGVPYINVADARVSPDSQFVVIAADGQIDSLHNAIIEAGDEDPIRHTRRHRIYDATVGVSSAINYGGQGKYNYIPVNNKDQYIDFGNIEVRRDTVTAASGEVGNDRDFYLTDRILFRGTATLDASQKYLMFEGEVKIESDNPAFKGTWFKFEKAIVNPDSVFIPIKEGQTDDEGRKLMVGLNYNGENSFFYSSFLEPLRNDDDISILTSKGGLTFDRKTKEFRIGAQDVIRERVYKGSLVSFNDSTNVVKTHGLMTFPTGFLENTGSLEISGDWNEDKRNNTMTTNLVIGCDFGLIPKDPIKNTMEYFWLVTENNRYYDFQERKSISALSELLDPASPEETNTYAFLEEMRNAIVTKDLKLSEMLPYTVLLAGVDFNYDRNTRALYCKEPVALLGLQGQGLYKYMNAKILYEFVPKAPDGSEANYHRMTVYLAVDNFNYIYFCLDGNTLRTRSYADAYNYPLQTELAKKKQNLEGYHIEVAEEDEVSKYIKNFDFKYGAAKRKAVDKAPK